VEVSFQQTVYTVMGSGDIVEVCVTLAGVLERNVTIILSTSDGSAVCKLCHRYTIVSAIVPLVLYIPFSKSFLHYTILLSCRQYALLRCWLY